eukprot:6096858-Pleurochrysis_carterae.AAC.1
MHARARVSEPHGLRTHCGHCKQCLHGRCVDRLRLRRSAQVCDLVVECCVAPSDERHDDEEDPAHCETVR